MTKKISVFIMILGLFLVVSSQNNVFASHATDNAYYLTIDWEYWDYDGDNTDWRILYADYTADIHLETNFQLVSNLFMENKTAIWGSKDVVINLGGSYVVWFVDNWNMPFSQKRLYFGEVDTILITPSTLYLSANGRRYFKSKNSILDELNADDFYIVVETLNVDYNEGYASGREVGRSQGLQQGYNEAKNEFGYDDNGTIISGQSAYNKGYSKATQDSGELKADIINFVPGVLGSIFMFFFQLGQIGILGITILDILGILVLISGLIFLIKFFF